MVALAAEAKNASAAVSPAAANAHAWPPTAPSKSASREALLPGLPGVKTVWEALHRPKHLKPQRPKGLKSLKLRKPLKLKIHKILKFQSSRAPEI